MVEVQGITNTINELDGLYNTHPEQAAYFSKLALLELCGWIEQSMDKIILDCSNAKLGNAQNKKHVEDIIVDKTYGFHYKEHFRLMLMKVIGLVLLEQIETRIEANGDLGILASQLGSLKVNRDKVAHTTITGITFSYEAPSKMKQYLKRISDILIRFDNELQAI